MRLLFRKILLIISITTFLVLAPTVIFYAMGYRSKLLNTSNPAVGVLLVETIPRRAQISINDDIKSNTPKAITNMTPGEILLSLKKEGYVTWQKNIPIIPTSVTNVTNVRLFPANPVKNMISRNIEAFSLSPNRQLIALMTNSQSLQVIDDEGTVILPAIKINSDIKQALWSPDSNYILLMSDSNISLIDIVNEKIKPTKLPAFSTLKQIVWDPRIPGRLLFLNNTNQLQAYQINDHTTDLLAKNITTFSTSSRNIYTTSPENGIDIFDLRGKLIDSIKLPGINPIKNLHITPGGNIAIQFEDNSLSFLEDNETLIAVAENIKSTGWSPDGQLLYVQLDDTSLHIYNAMNERLPYIPLQKLHLITRLSRAIRHPQWFAGGHHLLYQIDDEIIITEIDTRDHPITYTVDSTNTGDSQTTVGEEGERLFYLKKNKSITELIVADLVVESK
jgi:WD40 repeat protein